MVAQQAPLAVEELAAKLNALGEAVTFLGDGVPVYREMLKTLLQVPYDFAPAHLNRQRASAVAALALQYVREGKTETAAEHAPDYLRLSQAERERAEAEKRQAPGERAKTEQPKLDERTEAEQCRTVEV